MARTTIDLPLHIILVLLTLTANLILTVPLINVLLVEIILYSTSVGPSCCDIVVPS